MIAPLILNSLMQSTVFTKRKPQLLHNYFFRSAINLNLNWKKGENVSSQSPTEGPIRINNEIVFILLQSDCTVNMTFDVE